MNDQTKKIVVENGGHWIWVLSSTPPSYINLGKYLFFSEDRERLIEIAQNEIKNHDFHCAKVNSQLLGSNTDYVLCLYYRSDERKYELASRHKQLYSDVKYRYWKSDEDTLKGVYSKEFLSKLPKAKTDVFKKDKTKS